MIINNKAELKDIISEAKSSGKKVLVKKGVFDIIHPGHVFAIEEFVKQSDVIVILVQSDEFTSKKKGDNRPINSQEQRMKVIDGLSGVNYVYPDTCMSRNEYISFLEYLSPDIVAVSSIDEEKTQTYSGRGLGLQEFPDKNLPGYSTTEIIRKCMR
ncbi:MAG: adenylyltransferase/cytidyltransferase family protein [Candidatus Nanoarchaeia archaeon]